MTLLNDLETEGVKRRRTLSWGKFITRQLVSFELEVQSTRGQLHPDHRPMQNQTVKDHLIAIAYAI
jgi:hypothetical protein